jgi:hypothetical protein
MDHHVHGLEVIPEKKLASGITAYELEKETRVIARENGDRGLKAFFGGTANFERKLVDGMKASLASIKAAAEKD